MKVKKLLQQLGNLIFLVWSIENNILDYILEHFDVIENDMNNSLRNLYKKKDGTKIKT